MNMATYAHATAHVWTTSALRPHDIQTARTWTRRCLTAQRLPDQTIDDAVLVVSDLLTNVLHNAPDVAELTLLAEDGMLTVTCADRDPEPVRSGTLDPGSALSGHLMSVDALAYACFVRRRTGVGKRIVVLLKTTNDG